MKNLSKKVFLPLVILVAVVAAYFVFFSEPVLSKSQKETIDSFGQPSQFVVTYEPSLTDENDDEQTLSRTEVWYYPDLDMQVTFVAGELFDIEDYTQEDTDLTETPLKPQDFEFEMSLEQVKEALDNKPVERLEIPGFWEEGALETYVSDDAIFVMEHGYLTYIQTVGVGTDQLEQPEQTEGSLNEPFTEEIPQVETSLSIPQEDNLTEKYEQLYQEMYSAFDEQLSGELSDDEIYEAFDYFMLDLKNDLDDMDGEPVSNDEYNWVVEDLDTRYIGSTPVKEFMSGFINYYESNYAIIP